MLHQDVPPVIDLGPAAAGPPRAVNRHPDDDDLELLARVAALDRRAFETLYRRYHRRLLAYLLRVLGGRIEEAEEALDDTFYAAWLGARSFRGGSRVSSWLFGIAYRKGLKALERHGRRREVPAEEGAAEPPAPDSPRLDLERQELARAMAAALAGLPREQRRVVELTYYQGLSYPEIALLVGVPVGTVKTRMFHARRRLRELLPALGWDGEAGEAGR
jgi:RNA polymerase sigma-70 factor (ECF subfamily)